MSYDLLWILYFIFRNETSWQYFCYSVRCSFNWKTFAIFYWSEY